MRHTLGGTHFCAHTRGRNSFPLALLRLADFRGRATVGACENRSAAPAAPSLLRPLDALGAAAPWGQNLALNRALAAKRLAHSQRQISLSVSRPSAHVGWTGLFSIVRTYYKSAMLKSYTPSGAKPAVAGWPCQSVPSARVIAGFSAAVGQKVVYPVDLAFFHRVQIIVIGQKLAGGGQGAGGLIGPLDQPEGAGLVPRQAAGQVLFAPGRRRCNPSPARRTSWVSPARV